MIGEIHRFDRVKQVILGATVGSYLVAQWQQKPRMAGAGAARNYSGEGWSGRYANALILLL